MSLPPIHPILVHFTVALVPLSLFSDIIGRMMRRDSLHQAAWWMLLYASVVTPLTVIAGLVWFNNMGRPDERLMLIHLYLGTALAIVLPPLTIWRLQQYRRHAVPTKVYLLVAGIIVVVLTLQGHLGGILTFAATG